MTDYQMTAAITKRLDRIIELLEAIQPQAKQPQAGPSEHKAAPIRPEPRPRPWEDGRHA